MPRNRLNINYFKEKLRFLVDTYATVYEITASLGVKCCTLVAIASPWHIHVNVSSM